MERVEAVSSVVAMGVVVVTDEDRCSIEEDIVVNVPWLLKGSGVVLIPVDVVSLLWSGDV